MEVANAYHVNITSCSIISSWL